MSKPIDPRLLTPITPLELFKLTKGKWQRIQLAKLIKEVFIAREDYYTALKFRDLENKKS